MNDTKDHLQFQYCVPCLFGVEGLVADELRRMNLSDVRAEDGRVLFTDVCFSSAVSPTAPR